MTVPTDLEKLKALDPITYQTIIRGIPIEPPGTYFVLTDEGPREERYKQGWIPLDKVPSNMAMAWIQAVLQDACLDHGFWIKQRSTGKTFAAELGYMDAIDFYGYEVTHEAEGESMASALLKAYLKALEGSQ